MGLDMKTKKKLTEETAKRYCYKKSIKNVHLWRNKNVQLFG